VPNCVRAHCDGAGRPRYDHERLERCAVILDLCSSPRLARACWAFRSSRRYAYEQTPQGWSNIIDYRFSGAKVHELNRHDHLRYRFADFADELGLEF
jgi:hypothetical protein